MTKRTNVLLWTLLGVVILAGGVLGYMYKVGTLLSSADANKVSMKAKIATRKYMIPSTDRYTLLKGIGYFIEEGYIVPTGSGTSEWRTINSWTKTEGASSDDMDGKQDGILTFNATSNTRYRFTPMPASAGPLKWCNGAQDGAIGAPNSPNSKILTTGNGDMGTPAILRLNCPACVETNTCSDPIAPTPGPTNVKSKTPAPPQTPVPTPRPTASGIIRLDATWLQSGGSFPSKIYAKFGENSTQGPMSPVEITALNGTANFTGLTVGQYKIYACTPYVGGACSATNNAGLKTINVVQVGINDFTLSKSSGTSI